MFIDCREEGRVRGANISVTEERRSAAPHARPPGPQPSRRPDRVGARSLLV